MVIGRLLVGRELWPGFDDVLDRVVNALKCGLERRVAGGVNLLDVGTRIEQGPDRLVPPVRPAERRGNVERPGKAGPGDGGVDRVY